MKVKVKTVKQESFDVEIQAEMKVADIKGAIETQCGVDKFPRDALQIVFKGKRWTDDDATVEDMGVADGAVIVVVVKPTKPAAPPPAAPVAEPSVAAPAVAAAATPAAAPATDAPEDAATAVTGADAFATGSELQASIKAISEMGFEEAEVKRAMRAAFNNPERAVEYLMSGIPEHLVPPAAAPAAAGAAAPAAAVGEAAAAAAPAANAAPAAAAGGPNAAPLDMWGAPAAAAAGGGAAVAAGGGAGGVADLLQQVRSNPAAAQRIQQLLQSDPNQLMALLQELSRQNPEFAQQLQQNPQATLGALMGAGGGAEGGMPPPGQMTVELTADDDAAVGRLEALGFSRMACVQAYIACERSEELAANYLLENATDEDMQ